MPFPALLTFFKCNLEVVVYESVQRCLRFYLSHLNCVKMGAFQFYLQSGKQKSRVGGEKGSVRQRVIVMQQPVLLSPKFGVKSLHIFTQSP
jgi:hypothetical protein